MTREQLEPGAIVWVVYAGLTVQRATYVSPSVRLPGHHLVSLDVYDDEGGHRCVGRERLFVDERDARNWRPAHREPS